MPPQPIVTIKFDSDGKMIRTVQHRTATVWTPQTNDLFVFDNATCRLQPNGIIDSFIFPLVEETEKIYPFGMVPASQVGTLKTLIIPFGNGTGIITTEDDMYVMYLKDISISSYPYILNYSS